MRCRLLLPLAALSLFVAPVSAWAGRIAVLAPQLNPPGPVELRDRFHEAVVRGVSKAGDVMSVAEVREKLAATPDLLNCAGGPCVAAAAMALGAERVVTVLVDVAGKDYTIRLKAWDAVATELATVPDEKCEICTVREATRSGERAASLAVPALEKGLSRAPEAAPVPVAAPAPVAAPPVVVAPPAPVATPAPVAHQLPALTPAPVAAPAPVPAGSEKPSSGLRSGGIALLVAGGAAIVGMIPFAYYAGLEGGSGKYTSCMGTTDPQHTCAKVYSGNAVPAVLLGVGGAAAAVVGGVLLYLDSRSVKRPTALVVPVPMQNGAGLSASFEF